MLALAMELEIRESAFTARATDSEIRAIDSGRAIEAVTRPIDTPRSRVRPVFTHSSEHTLRLPICTPPRTSRPYPWIWM